MKKRIMLHPKDTMTAEERLQAAINLQVPDRVPSGLAPIGVAPPGARQTTEDDRAGVATLADALPRNLPGE